MVLHCRAIRISEANRGRRYDGRPRQNGMCLVVSVRTVDYLISRYLDATDPGVSPHRNLIGDMALRGQPARRTTALDKKRGAGSKEQGARSEDKEQEEGVIPHWSGEAASPPIF